MKLLICMVAMLITVRGATARETADQKKADFLYTHMAYRKALDYYRKISPAPTAAVTMGRIADCYRLTGQPAEANLWYAKAVAAKGGDDVLWLSYARTLHAVQNDSMAATMLRKYIAGHASDRRAAGMLRSYEMADTLRAAPPVGTAQLMPFNSNGSDFGPALRGSQLFFTSDSVAAGKAKKSATPFYNIYTVTDNNIAEAYGATRLLHGKTNEQYHDGPCAFDASGNMYFTRTTVTDHFFTRAPAAGSSGVSGLQIMLATGYDDATGRYTSLTPFKYNSSHYSVAHPTVSRDGRWLFFISDMPGGAGGTDIYMCEKMPDGSWGQPRNAGNEINTEGNELFPFVDLDNTLYFASDGLFGFGGLDLYRATFNKAAHTFNTPVNMGAPVNSAYDDISLVFSNDGSVGYFASDRPAARAGDNIYSYLPRRSYLSVSGTDDVTGAPVTNYALTLLGCTEKCRMIPNAGGSLTLQVYPRVSYTWLVTAPGYQPQYISLADTTALATTDTFRRVLRFNPRTSISLHMAVYDETDNASVVDSRIVYYRNGHSNYDTATLSKAGVYNAALEPNSVYHFIPLKDNYHGKEKVISTAGITPDAGEVIISEDVYLRK